MLKTRERIITVQDLAQDVDRAISNAQREPLVVTKSGRPAAYLIGMELLDALVARLEALEDVELVMGTAVGEEQYQREALGLGASEFLTKPFSPKKLFQRVSELAGAEAHGPAAPQP